MSLVLFVFGNLVSISPISSIELITSGFFSATIVLVAAKPPTPAAAACPACSAIFPLRTVGPLNLASANSLCNLGVCIAPTTPKAAGVITAPAPPVTELIVPIPAPTPKDITNFPTAFGLLIVPNPATPISPIVFLASLKNDGFSPNAFCSNRPNPFLISDIVIN